MNKSSFICLALVFTCLAAFVGCSTGPANKPASHVTDKKFTYVIIHGAWVAAGIGGTQTICSPPTGTKFIAPR
jgi:hypothetical protein